MQRVARHNLALKLTGGPRRGGRALAPLRAAAMAAQSGPSSSCQRPAGSLTLMR